VFEVQISDERFSLEMRSEIIPLGVLLKKVRRYVLCLQCDSAFFELISTGSICWNCKTNYRMFDDRGETGGVAVLVGDEDTPTLIVGEDGAGSAVAILCEQLDIEYDSFLHFWNV
jgi:hypothetical protein